MSSSPSPPPAPDYAGAAQQTAAGNLEAIKYQTEANRINQYTPFGSQTYTKTGDNNWTQTTTLTPEAQHALDSQMAMQSGRSDLANKMMGAVANSYGFTGPNAGPTSYAPAQAIPPTYTETPAKLSAADAAQQLKDLEGQKGVHDLASRWGGLDGDVPYVDAYGNASTYDALKAQITADSQPTRTQVAATSAPAAPTPYDSNFGGSYSAFDAPHLSSYLANVNGVSTDSVGHAGEFSSNARQNLTFNSTAPGLNTTYDRFSSSTPGLDTNAYGFSGAGAGQDTRNLAASGYTGGLQGVTQNASDYLGGVNNVMQNAPQFNQDNAQLYAQKAYDAQMALLRPGLDDQQQKLQNSLALQGLNPGTEANNNAQSAYSMARAAQENALAASSYLSGAQTAQGNYASQLAGFNASNAAQNQAFGQSMNVFGADNQARTQALDNRLAVQAGDLAGQAQSNAARNVTFNQGATTYGLNSQAVQQANAARTQQLQNELSSYGANQNATSAENAARAQQYAQQLQAYQAQNAASATQFNQDAASYNASLQALATNAQLQEEQNRAQAQAYSQAVNNYGMDWQQAQTLRNQPLNEMNALLSGQQVQNPQFNSYAMQGNAGGADILGATQAQGQWDQGIYNQQAATAAGNNSAAAGLAGTAAMAFMMY